MSETVNLPALGESVTEGTVTRWLKEVGDEVAVDEPLVEVSTDKVDTEVPSPVAGVIEEILVDEDEDVEVGAPLVVIGDGSGSGSSDSGSDESEEADDEAASDDAEDSAEAAEDEGASDDKEQSAPKKSSGGSGTDVTLPALGESVTEGTVTRWLKEVGEEVELDEPLLEVSTDKVDTEVPSPVAGTLLEIKVQEDEDAEVGQVLAVIGDADAADSSDEDSDDSEDSADTEDSADSDQSAGSEDSAEDSAEEVEDAAVASSTPEATDEAAEQKASSGSKEKQSKDDSADKADADKKAEQTASSGSSPAQPSAESTTAYVTPLVRKLAKSKGVDLGSVKGTGVGGRIRKQDVLAAADSAPASTESAQGSPAAADTGEPTTIPAVSDKRGTTEKAPRIRMTIAKRMRESLQESAQLTQVTEVDMTRVAALRNKAKNAFQDKHGAKLTFLPFFAQAVAESLKANPSLNSTFKEDQKEIVYNGSEDLAIAVDTPRGLMVPVIRNAGDLQLPGLASSIADLGARAKDGSIGPDELTGGTFTITNIGSFGALFDTPIINQPQVAILGTGTIVKRPMVIQDADGNDVIAIRHMCYLSLTYDHRIVDGADAGRFLQTMKARLEEGRFEGALEL